MSSNSCHENRSHYLAISSNMHTYVPPLTTWNPSHDKIVPRKSMANVSSVWLLSLFSLCPFSVPVHDHQTAVVSLTQPSVTLATASVPMISSCSSVFKSHLFCQASLFSVAVSACCTPSASFYGFSYSTNAGPYLLILLEFTVIFIPLTAKWSDA